METVPTVETQHTSSRAQACSLVHIQMQRKGFFIYMEEAAMSTSISKSINHPPSGFNPYAPDPASECIVIRGREHFCSILFASQKPENVKTTLVKYLHGDPENSELSCCFFICCRSPPLRRQTWISEELGGGGGGSSYTSFHILE